MGSRAMGAGWPRWASAKPTHLEADLEWLAVFHNVLHCCVVAALACGDGLPMWCTSSARAEISSRHISSLPNSTDFCIFQKVFKTEQGNLLPAVTLTILITTLNMLTFQAVDYYIFIEIMRGFIFWGWACFSSFRARFVHVFSMIRMDIYLAAWVQ